MTQVNYAAMSDQELKHYILTHRNDQNAFHAYMDRRHSRPSRIAVEPDDPAWEEKVTSAIQAQLGANR
ncbi:hypothetical protein K9N68_24415 [Kovacikia minuta CCNUW1]|uniref:DUF6887 family protein n=1 Tax=Kovacikia minuta TaxID=2931930 RepID=UPI001CCE573C|nr:hypothetical protein [Kovacikia minuta]UBF24779.1 hypothetical protein K9N68_24415 [Kovacikia minuta CCNUW1]